jgi:Phage gp6-like head-tail connector protein
MAYVTLQDVKTSLRITVADDDAIIADIISDVTAAIDSYCHRHFEPESDHGPAASHTHYFTPLLEVDGGDLLDWRTLNLRHDLAELTSITNGDGTSIAAGDVVLLPLNVKPTSFIRIKSAVNKTWTYSGSPEGAVAIAGKWSYSLNVPDDIHRAALAWSEHMYRLRTGSAPTSVDVTISADGSAFVSSGMPRGVAQLLRPYIRRS